MAYCLSKSLVLAKVIMPGWTGFNILMRSTKVLPLSKIGYLPIKDASPTDMSTVFTILSQSVAIADSMELEQIAVGFDQAIYAKAQQIRWQNDTFKKRHQARRIPHCYVISSYYWKVLSRLWTTGYSHSV